MRVLIVDDEMAFATPLAERLRLRSFDVLVAKDGEEAQRLMAQAPSDLVLMDVGLPNMDGLALLQIFRRQYPEQDVVMLSGAGDVRKAVVAMQHGARNWLSKPVRLEDVLAECGKVQQRAQAKAEAQRLTEAARWRVLGRVAEGVAHEVNNPLNIIVQAAGLIEDDLEDLLDGEKSPEADEVYTAITTIKTQGKRVRELTQKLLMVGHGMDIRIEPLSLPDLVENVLGMQSARLESTGTTVTCDFSEIDAKPEGVRQEVQQILLHVFENALDAIEIKNPPQGGRVSVRAKRQEDRDGSLWYALAIEDNGTGIPEEVLPHIFDPFFSTRSLEPRRQNGDSTLLGRFAGLGLAVARSLAHVRGGKLTGKNREDGTGACFTLLLPLGEGREGDVTEG
ncbi:MAG: response regulator [Desulfovibrio sp.]|nr:response regulator [Desulfovibrio sp.]